MTSDSQSAWQGCTLPPLPGAPPRTRMRIAPWENGASVFGNLHSPETARMTAGRGRDLPGPDLPACHAVK